MAPVPGQLVVVSGPSGVGKTTVLRQLLNDVPDLIASISATTRPPRTGEKNGVDYHFLSSDEFARRKQQGDFLESCRVYGRQHWYGTYHPLQLCSDNSCFPSFQQHMIHQWQEPLVHRLDFAQRARA